MDGEIAANDGSVLSICVEWIKTYFRKSEAPNFPPPPRCYPPKMYREFEIVVWNTLESKVPFGSTITYGELAAAVGNPGK